MTFDYHRLLWFLTPKRKRTAGDLLKEQKIVEDLRNDLHHKNLEAWNQLQIQSSLPEGSKSSVIQPSFYGFTNSTGIGATKAEEALLDNVHNSEFTGEDAVLLKDLGVTWEGDNRGNGSST